MTHVEDFQVKYEKIKKRVLRPTPYEELMCEMLIWLCVQVEHIQTHLGEQAR